MAKMSSVKCQILVALRLYRKKGVLYLVVVSASYLGVILHPIRLLDFSIIGVFSYKVFYPLLFDI